MLSRRELWIVGVALALGAFLSTFVSPDRREAHSRSTRKDTSGNVVAASTSDEVYYWISANAHLPLFVAHDHPA
jgi:hypothetical protein